MDKNIPEIRFDGFDSEWEQRKLSDLCSLFTDGDWIEAKDQSTEGVRLVQTGNVGVTHYLDKINNAKWISEDTFNRLKCEEIFEGDILISRLPDPAGRACIMPNLGTKMITAVDCTIVRTLPNVNREYLVQYLSTERYFKEINACLAGGTRQRVSRGNLAEFDIPFPNLADEQKAIGNYFKSLDHLITLHQQKYDKLVATKKSMLDKMFPKNGNSVPEIRFAGFDEPWEKHMFCDLFKEKREKTEKEDEDTLLSCAINGIFLNTELFGHFRGTTTVGYLKVKKNDLILSAQNLHLGNANVNLRFEHGIISPAYKVFDIIACDPCFINTWVKKDDTKNFFLAATTEGASQCRKNIEWNTLDKQYVFVPSLPEQKLIGEYFIQLDNLISLQQQEIEKLKNIKKSLLDKMFV